LGRWYCRWYKNSEISSTLITFFSNTGKESLLMNNTKPSFNVDQVARIIEQHKNRPGALLPILHGIQDELSFIPSEVLPVVAKQLNLSRAEVHGVVSFYHYFRTSPPGRNIVQICRAESCQAMGSRNLEAHAKQSLGIDFNQTSIDREFTLLPVYCLGNCACSPAVRIGDVVYGNVDIDTFDQLMHEHSAVAVEVK
jgi:formate dehydrogenase subunit gamma